MTSVGIVGSGPNGLAAAAHLAVAGVDVTVYEAADTVGGGARTLDGRVDGYRHDWGSAVHPMAFVSPFFRQIGLAERVPFVVPDVSYGHALGPNRAAVAWRDIDRTAAELGVDGAVWKRLLVPIAADMEAYGEILLGSMLRAPLHPIRMLRFGSRLLATANIDRLPVFRSEEARALLTGVIAHSAAPVDSLASVAAGFVLAAAAHAGGWPVPIGGSGAIAAALAEIVSEHGGRILTGQTVTDARDLAHDAVIFDTTPSAAAKIGGSRIRPAFARAARRFVGGNGIAKVDFSLSGPVPWSAEALRLAPTVHLGGTRAQIAAGERELASGRYPRTPYVLASQPSVVDATRAPSGGAVLWTYTHVPRGSERDMTETITALIEESAPGFRDLIVDAHHTSAAEIGDQNATMPAGDFAAGAITLRQLLARPWLRADPWHIGEGMYLASASVTPGPGVHGMGGFHAAESLLSRIR